MALETELKYLLSESAFRRLTHALGKPGKVAEQLNVYFDTPSRTLARRGMAVRIRTIGTQRTLTVKRQSRNVQSLGLSVREEEECRLTASLAQLIQKSPSSAKLLSLSPWNNLVQTLGAHKVSELKQTASMHTRRHLYPMGKGIVLELDEVSLPNGHKFFEVELECHHPASARKFLLNIFKTTGIRARPVRRTKLARVMRELRK